MCPLQELSPADVALSAWGMLNSVLFSSLRFSSAAMIISALKKSGYSYSAFLLERNTMKAASMNLEASHHLYARAARLITRVGTVMLQLVGSPAPFGRRNQNIIVVSPSYLKCCLWRSSGDDFKHDLRVVRYA